MPLHIRLIGRYGGRALALLWGFLALLGFGSGRVFLGAFAALGAFNV